MLKKLSCSLLALSLIFGSATLPNTVVNVSATSNSAGSSSFHDKGAVRVNGSVIIELRSVYVNEMINLETIKVVNNSEVLGWFYDEELTQEIPNVREFIVTSDSIENGIFAQLGDVVVVDEATAAEAGANPVPSTGVALLGKLF